ncbi:Uncharacterised protein [Bordetella pertussis]|nr:Uncharacterised protein [Bordetella pertussis]
MPVCAGCAILSFLNSTKTIEKWTNPPPKPSRLPMRARRLSSRGATAIRPTRTSSRIGTIARSSCAARRG